MKQFIVLIGVLPILLLFMLQYTLDQKNHDNVARLQEFVYTSKEEAKQQGCFTEKIRTKLVANISEGLDIDQEDIALVLDSTPKYRMGFFDERELIHYKVSVPIEKIIAGNELIGISDVENQYFYTIESWTASELVRN